MEEALFRTMLFDLYGELLTDKQKEYFDLHYNEDLSLAEIAQSEGATGMGFLTATFTVTSVSEIVMSLKSMSRISTAGAFSRFSVGVRVLSVISFILVISS